MTHTFRICPTNPLIIEWRLEQDGARWGFFRVSDSPNDARRALDVLNTAAESERQAPTLLSMGEMEAA